MILGTDLTGATSVTFNGTAATFTVIAPTAIKVDVPSGAATGAVQVVTPTGTLISNVPFQVLWPARQAGCPRHVTRRARRARR